MSSCCAVQCCIIAASYRRITVVVVFRLVSPLYLAVLSPYLPFALYCRCISPFCRRACITFRLGDVQTPYHTHWYASVWNLACSRHSPASALPVNYSIHALGNKSNSLQGTASLVLYLLYLLIRIAMHLPRWYDITDVVPQYRAVYSGTFSPVPLHL